MPMDPVLEASQASILSVEGPESAINDGDALLERPILYLSPHTQICRARGPSCGF